MSLPHKVWCHLSIGLTVFGLFVILIGVVLRIISSSNTDLTEKTRFVATVLTVIGCVIIVVAKVLLICSLKFKCSKKSSTIEKSKNAIKPLELLQTKKHIFQQQMSCSVSTPNWSYHSKEDLKSSHQLLNEERITLCPIQQDEEQAL